MVTSDDQPRASQGAEAECQASIDQHYPLESRDRGTDADDAVQGATSTCHRGTAIECQGSNVSVKNNLIGSSTSVVLRSKESATLQCGLNLLSDLHERSDVTLPQTEELAIHPSGVHAPRQEEDVQAVCLRHHESDWEQGEHARARA